ncbi:glucosamine-6-phosphate deaminase [Candidatus Woesearchaeota archaeon]|nr:glucosamine-6-phosphate deaminase [Candidatus Woesearchaeota archaeon]
MAEKKFFNDIEITVADDYPEMCRIASEIILKSIEGSKETNLLVPTGTTPKGIYKILSGKDVFENVRFFNFDEYCTEGGLLPEDDPRSYKYYMKKHIFDNIDCLESYFPSEKNISEEGAYDRLIAEKGGIDICLVACGEDGHIFGFNFPGSSFDSVTRKVKMDEDTLRVNKKLTGMDVPEYAVTTGISTGMKSRKIVFIVSGKRKAEILKKIVYSDISEEIPASVLRKHKNCVWIVDKGAASEL